MGDPKGAAPPRRERPVRGRVVKLPYQTSKYECIYNIIIYNKLIYWYCCVCVCVSFDHRTRVQRINRMVHTAYTGCIHYTNKLAVLSIFRSVAMVFFF